MATSVVRTSVEVPRIAQTLLRRWQFGVSAAGELWIEPVGTGLRLVELGQLVRQLRPHCRDGFPTRLMFRLSGFPVIGATAETVERAIRQFAHDLGIEILVR